MKNEVLYLAGPMRGLPNFNFDSFAESRVKLRSLGWTVICPAERDEQLGFNPSGLTGTEDLVDLGFSLSKAFQQSFTDLFSCDGIVLLPGWNKSEGAKAEVLVAKLTGRQVYEFFSHRPNVLVEMTGRGIKTQIEVVA